MQMVMVQMVLIMLEILKMMEDHSHAINGSVSANGGTESRPVNYGVNYIIKL